MKEELGRSWGQWFVSHGRSRFSWDAYKRVSSQFVSGFCKGARKKEQNWVLLPTDRKVSAVLTVRDEGRMVSKILDQLGRIPFAEVIVVLDGTSEGTFQRISGHSTQPIIVQYENAPGIDVGRAVGARLSDADILIVLDGSMEIPAFLLLPFAYAVHRGADIALNNVSPYLEKFKNRDTVTIFKEFLNFSLGRRELGANSMTSVPHALSRKAIDVIGDKNLMIPPLAQTIALLSGLSIDCTASVKVRSEAGKSGRVAEMIIGDHLEALHYAMNQRGERLSYEDSLRKRQLIGGSPGWLLQA